MPTLSVIGSLDNNTPGFQVDEVRKSFQHSVHIIAENASHESTLVNPKVQQVVVYHLIAKDVSPVQITLPRLQFRPISGT